MTSCLCGHFEWCDKCRPSTNQNKELKCPDHPKYQAKRAPRGKCKVCEAIWVLKSLKIIS